MDPSPLLSASGRPLPSNWLMHIIMIWSGQAFSIFTSYATSFACVWWVTESTGSALMLSLLTICAYLPQGLLSPLGGVFADRYNRKYVMIAADMGVGIISLLLAVAFALGHTSIWLLMGAVIARAVGMAFHGPAMMASMPMLVPEKQLLGINTLDQLLMGISGVISPACGILLYTTWGLPAVLALDFLGALIACAALLPVRIPNTAAMQDSAEPKTFSDTAAAREFQESSSRAQAPTSEVNVHTGLTNQTLTRTLNEDAEHPSEAFSRDNARVGLIHQTTLDLIEGWNVLRAVRGLFLLLIILTVLQIAFGPVGALYPLLTYDHFHGDGYLASLVEALFASGLIVGSILIMSWGNRGHLVGILSLCASVFGALCAMCGVIPADKFWIFAIVCAAMGIVCAGLNAPFITLVQTWIPEHQTGRVLGFSTALFGVTPPLGIFLGGIITESIGVTLFFLVDGILCIAIAILIALPASIRSLDRRPPKSAE